MVIIVPAESREQVQLVSAPVAGPETAFPFKSKIEL